VTDMLTNSPAGLDGYHVSETQGGARVVDQEVASFVEFLGMLAGVKI